ncbi:hypothetical protein FAI40_01225 [Acetobacteraceae bacterium]|nr:hypothetical protein FAI40_01225 [Acetobacteraceae bacterium]
MATSSQQSPNPKTILRQNQNEKEIIRDTIWIVGGIFIALLFIGLASYIVRYVSSRPSNSLVVGEVIGLASPKNHPISGKLSLRHKEKLLLEKDGECQKFNGKVFQIPFDKGFTAYYRGNIGHYLSFELINVEALSNCPYEMILRPQQARIAMSVYMQQQKLTHNLVSALPAALPSALSFTEEDLKSAEKEADPNEDENSDSD